MLFNKPAFFLFLAAALAGDRLAPRDGRNAFLLAASLFFYGCWDWRFVPLLLACSSIDFAAGLALAAASRPGSRRLILAAALTANLLLLAFFKAGNALWPAGIILPVGLSFYTFQSMSYSIDVYRGDVEPATSWIDYTLFVSFFPHLVAGPIQRASNLLAQLQRPARLVSAQGALEGLTLILVGYVKKAVFADSIAPQVDHCFASYASLPPAQLLLGLILFSVQIYWDFSGYCDIARGLAKWFGVEMMINFGQPYLSRNIREFWTRWNVSLSAWLRDYLYIPLGGNRLGRARTAVNLMATMIIGGLWHGAGWNFLIWGALHGSYLVIHRLARPAPVDRGRAALRRPGDRAAFALSCGATYAAVLVAWIPFRAPTPAAAWGYFSRLARWPGPPPSLDQIALLLLVLAALLLLDLPMYLGGDDTAFLRAPAWLYWPAACAGGAAAAAAVWLGQSAARPFIYFQF